MKKKPTTAGRALFALSALLVSIVSAAMPPLSPLPYAPPESVPFGSVIDLPERSSASYVVEVANTNLWGPWVYSTGGSFPFILDGHVQFMSHDSEGWHGTTLKVVKGQTQNVDHADPTFRLDAPWRKSDGTYRDGWARVSLPGAVVMGVYHNQTWPKTEALLVRTSKSDLFVMSTGSPSRGLRIVGSDNDATVSIVQGPQSNNIQDLAGANVEGDRNTLRGTIDAQVCGAFFDGQANRALDLSIRVAGIGDDVSGLMVRRGSHDFRATNVSVWMPKSQWPSRHGRNAFYVDDRSSRAVLYNCAAYGPWDRGAFFHGGSDNRIERFRSFGPAKAYEFARHFTDPDGFVPPGNRAVSVTEGRL